MESENHTLLGTRVYGHRLVPLGVRSQSSAYQCLAMLTLTLMRQYLRAVRVGLNHRSSTPIIIITTTADLPVAQTAIQVHHFSLHVTFCE